MHQTAFIDTPWGCMCARCERVDTHQLLMETDWVSDAQGSAITSLQFVEDELETATNMSSQQVMQDDSYTASRRPITKQALVRCVTPAGLDSPVIAQLVDELEAYAHGVCDAFSVPLALSGTAFMQQVWRAACKISYGETVSYGRLAERIGARRAARAVGSALGKNPVLIVVPCHRVVPQCGGVGNYRAGVLRKEALLAHERMNAAGRPLV